METSQAHSVIIWIGENLKAITLTKTDDLNKDKYYLLMWKTTEPLPHFAVLKNDVLYHRFPVYNVEQMAIQNYIRAYPDYELVNVFEVLKPVVTTNNQLLMESKWTNEDNCLIFCFDYLGLKYVAKSSMNLEYSNEIRNFSPTQKLKAASLWGV
ncbi:hypothetical protein DLAC_11723 [Tieghemostelium lacteum]|uniref:Uncharacterized protein n=1 Tax=Tieghemostelium lacteum TaxID=361077 RepID=A0A151Z7J1_TIELA|nr:hypothetical protein DLAC_11723 [Tieghemostelium lacteum]|eukprot:KYQ89932.1 hypothetical protein DLAC_11723 [Tieghemostelium lacteum]